MLETVNLPIFISSRANGYEFKKAYMNRVYTENDKFEMYISDEIHRIAHVYSLKLFV